LIPFWGEGPKPWIYNKLQWNPNQNVDALLDDWYRAAVGEQDAP
jgi:alpha-glucuronidase